jgi:hypothetical protein
VGVGGGQPARDLGRDEAQLLHLVAGVEAMASRAPVRDDRLVALLPVADRRGGEIEHPGDGADAVDPAAATGWLGHAAMLTAP